jgi:hypothetical protein
MLIQVIYHNIDYSYKVTVLLSTDGTDVKTLLQT